MYAKEVITRLLLAQQTAKEISEVVECHLATVYRAKKFLQDAVAGKWMAADYTCFKRDKIGPCEDCPQFATVHQETCC